MATTDRHEQAEWAFLDALTGPALLVDRDGLIRAANAACALSLGVPLTELVGKPALGFLPPDLAEQRGKQIERALAGERLVFEDSYQERHLLNHLQPIIDEQGTVTGVAIFAIDVTPLKSAERAARESEAKYRTIVNTCLEGVWQIDRDARTVFANFQMASMLGYRTDEFIGRPLEDFMDTHSWEDAQKKLARRQQGISERHDFCLRHKDGRSVWVRISTAPVLDEQGGYQGAVALVTDVTEARILAQKLQHAQKLESLGVLAGGIAHDFNNILAGILGNIGLAQHELPQESRIGFFLGEAEQAARRAADLTRQMLAYAGRGSFVVQPFDLNQCIVDVRSLLNTVVPKNAALEVDLSPGLGLARGDATQMRQVIMNLVMNASDALGGVSGAIRVRTSAVQATADDFKHAYLVDKLEPGNYVCVEVSDTGAGMDQDTLARLFDPFFTTKASGHGLGLALVLGILRAHRAGIFIDTQPGRGTTFKILIPEASGASQRAAAKSADNSKLGHESKARRVHGRVLVVDDEVAVREITSRTLSRMGFECVLCENGAQALSLLSAQEEPIDLVVLDMTMPEMGGQEVLQAMRRMGQTTPVMLMSGYAAEETNGAVTELGPTAFIEKPFGPRELSEQVRRLMPEPDDEEPS